jgi:hypothetical protein
MYSWIDNTYYIHRWSNFHSYSGHGCTYFSTRQRQIFYLSRKNFCEKGHWTFLAQRFLRRFLNFFYVIKCVDGKSCCPTLFSGLMNSKTWFCTMSESFQVNLSFSGPVLFEIFSIFSYISRKNSFPYNGFIHPHPHPPDGRCF